MDYIGCTDDLKSRLEKHQKGYVSATKDRLPVKLDLSLFYKINTKLLNLKNI
jgi:predicted GIY-YIG superfamily endonuclease